MPNKKISVKYKLFNIPTLYITPGQQLLLKIDTTSHMEMSYQPKIAGTFRMDSLNVITLIPAASDQGTLRVMLKTGSDTVSFAINIRTLKQESESFLPYKVGAALDKTNFRSISIDSTDPNNKHLIIEGSEIVFDNSRSNELNSILFEKNEMSYAYKRVSIFAEKLIVKRACWFPGVKMDIRAREIIFDASSATPSIDITPYTIATPVKASPDAMNGDTGATCDTMWVYTKTPIRLINYNDRQALRLLIARGGKGGPAPMGSDGIDYPRTQYISNYRSIPLSHAGNCGGNPAIPYYESVNVGENARNTSLVHVRYKRTVNTTYEKRIRGPREVDYVTTPCAYTLFVEINLFDKIFNSETIAKAKPQQGGAPGRGGQGGVILANQDVRSIISISRGQDGDPDSIRVSGRVSEPGRELWSYTQDDTDREKDKGYTRVAYPEAVTIRPLSPTLPQMPNGTWAYEQKSE